MSKQVRVGVIGTSSYADTSHLPFLKSHPHAQLAAICGRNRDRAEQMAHKYEIPLVFTDYRDMIEKGHLQAIVIATPDDLHYPMTMDALEAGLHVMCEKPLALNAVQAKEMAEKAAVVGVKNMVCFTFRWFALYRYMKVLIDQGYVGRCFDCDIRYLAGYARTPSYLWRFDRRYANGAVGDIGAHMIDLARWYVGDIAQVSARLTTIMERPALEGQPYEAANDAAILMLQFENGAQGTIRVNAVAHPGDRGQEQHIILYGESGTLESDYSMQGSDSARGITKTPCKIQGTRRDATHFEKLDIPDEIWEGTDRSNLFSGFTTQSIGDRLFIDSILEDRPAVPSFYDGFKVQQVIDAAIESHQKECWVSSSKSLEEKAHP
ncbi:MAG: Gfo/Idh/MocA family oxidoreductase [Anaerolineae bacterium]|nr:Gfo/Idh/MocA family oxidoreductase [Anaerolineae bacterium]